MVPQVFAIADTAIGTTEKYGGKVLLGNYCLSYANDDRNPLHPSVSSVL
jgi:hypothetical protein